MISGLLVGAALGTLVWASVAVGTEECTLANRQVWEATVGQAILLLMSVLAAAGAAASLAVGHSRRPSLVILITLSVGGLWFIISWIVFLISDFGHCPIGPISL
jgi:hypothetical protein